MMYLAQEMNTASHMEHNVEQNEVCVHLEGADAMEKYLGHDISSCTCLGG